MKTHIIEATQSGPVGSEESAPWSNWGKFLVGRFDLAEWGLLSAISDRSIPLMAQVGWSPEHFLVLDLQTGEGMVTSRGWAAADLRKHAIWVCPLFEPFLAWLYTQDLSDLDALPPLIVLPDAEFKIYEERQPGLLRLAQEQPNVPQTVFSRCSDCGHIYESGRPGAPKRCPRCQGLPTFEKPTARQVLDYWERPAPETPPETPEEDGTDADRP